MIDTWEMVGKAGIVACWENVCPLTHTGSDLSFPMCCNVSSLRILKLQNAKHMGLRQNKETASFLATESIQGARLHAQFSLTCFTHEEHTTTQVLVFTGIY